MQTCYDVRFPEVTRHLVDAGVDLVVLPSQWVRGPLKESAWRTLVTARALENTVYVAAADQAPPTGAGNSMVVDPMGVELVTVGEDTDVAVAWISPERLAQVRHINPALELRRFRVAAPLSRSDTKRWAPRCGTPTSLVRVRPLRSLRVGTHRRSTAMISTTPAMIA